MALCLMLKKQIPVHNFIIYMQKIGYFQVLFPSVKHIKTCNYGYVL